MVRASFCSVLEKGFKMKHCLTAGALVTAAVVLSTAVAGDTLKSGLPVGGSPTPFHPPDSGWKRFRLLAG